MSATSLSRQDRSTSGGASFSPHTRQPIGTSPNPVTPRLDLLATPAEQSAWQAEEGKRRERVQMAVATLRAETLLRMTKGTA